MQFSGIPPGYDRLRRAQPIASDELIGYSTADAVQVPSPGGRGLQSTDLSTKIAEMKVWLEVLGAAVLVSAAPTLNSLTASLCPVDTDCLVSQNTLCCGQHANHRVH